MQVCAASRSGETCLMVPLFCMYDVGLLGLDLTPMAGINGALGVRSVAWYRNRALCGYCIVERLASTLNARCALHPVRYELHCSTPVVGSFHRSLCHMIHLLSIGPGPRLIHMMPQLSSRNAAAPERQLQ